MASLAACAIVVSGISFASAAPTATSAGKATVKHVFIKANLQKQRLYFDEPRAVNTGDILKVVNRTDPNQIGPHSFSLVDPSVIPDSKAEENACFDKGNICRVIARIWHEINLKNEKVNAFLSKAGRRGWDTEGTLTTRGDSFFFGGPQGETFAQKVSAGGPTVLSFICLIHPNMDGSILVLPKG